MAEQTAVVYVEGKSAVIAGLSWQLLGATNKREKISKVREMAQAIDAKQYVAKQANALDYVGLYSFDSFIADEERPKKAYSFASLLCRKFGDQDTVVLWKIESGNRVNDVCLVVIEKGVPITDLVLSLQDAQSTAESYTGDNFRDQPYRLLTNDQVTFQSAQLLNSSTLRNQLDKADAIVGLPIDPVTLLTALGGLVLAVGGVFGLNEYLEYSAQQELLAQAQSADQTPAYLAQLDQTKGKLGLSATEVGVVLEAVLGQPFVLNEWVLKEVTCSKSNCTSLWGSEGGYTKEIIATLAAQKPQVDPKNYKSIRFSFDLPVKESGVAALGNLPKKKALTDQLYDEQQVWNKAGLNHQLSLDGQVWPAGFANIPDPIAMKRYPLKVVGNTEVVSNFLAEYQGRTFWDSVKLTVNPFTINNAVTFELQGAFYAY